jgi:hypothetical protein
MAIVIVIPTNRVKVCQCASMKPLETMVHLVRDNYRVVLLIVEDTPGLVELTRFITSFLIDNAQERLLLQSTVVTLTGEGFRFLWDCLGHVGTMGEFVRPE